jgi:hypothetical protein
VQHTTARLSSGVQVTNPGPQTANVTLDVTRSDGRTHDLCVNGFARIPPGGSHTWYLCHPRIDEEPRPLSWFGFGRLSADQPVLAIVNDISLAEAYDAAIYSGLPCRKDADSVLGFPLLAPAGR